LARKSIIYRRQGKVRLFFPWLGNRPWALNSGVKKLVPDFWIWTFDLKRSFLAAGLRAAFSATVTVINPVRISLGTHFAFLLEIKTFATSASFKSISTCKSLGSATAIKAVLGPRVPPKLCGVDPARSDQTSFSKNERR